MKIESESRFSALPVLKLFQVLVFSFFLFTLFTVNLYPQEIIISSESQVVRDAFREIEEQTSFSFFYNDSFYDLNSPLGIEVAGRYSNIGEAMSAILQNTSLTFRIIDENLIVIMPEDLQPGIIVSGTVISSENDRPVPGVTVSVKETSDGAVTDINGYFTVRVPSENSVLRFSFVGMKTREVMVGERSVVNVTLDPDIVGLDEIVVTGYGVQQRRDLTGSVSSVDFRNIDNMPVSSLERAIQGRATGVEVTSSSGVPGGSVSVIIRGIGSIAGDNQPLYIIDGVQVFAGDPSRRLRESNALAGLSFDDIESMDILKDASAAAIYGAQGANGVVIITTKRGEACQDAKTRFEFRLSRGYTRLIRQMDVMDGPQWVETFLEAYRNRYGENHSRYLDRIAFAEGKGWLETTPEGAIDFSNAPGDNWQDAVFRTGNLTEARLSASGGTEQTRFYVSGSYNYTEGHVISSYFNRASFRVNLDHAVNERVSFDNTTSVNVFGQNTVPDGGRYTNPMRGAAMMVPVNPVRNPDGSYYGVPRGCYGNIYPNIVHDALINYNKGLTTKIIQNFGFNLNINEDLTFRSAWGADFNDIVEDELRDPRTSDGFVNRGQVYKYQTRYFIWQSTNTLSYSRTFVDKHDISSLAGFEYKQQLYESISAAGYGLPGDKFNILGATAEPVTARAGYSNYKIAGFFGRLNYAYDDRYISTFTLRYDGSSRFGSASRWGMFPSGAVAWRISSEPFMESLDNLDDMKIRLSYGVSGSMSGIGDFAGRGLFGGGTSYLNQPGIHPISLPNVYLNWEKSTTLNTGLSLTAYRGRINFEIDIFRRISSDLLLSRPLPTSSGWSSITENIGKVKNDGVEVALSTINVRTRRFRWSTDFNITHVKNEILALLPGQDYFDSRTMVGRSIGDRHHRQWAGVNPADGRPMWYDAGMNITYRTTGDDRKWFGPFNPTLYGGLNNTFMYGNFDVSFFFQFAGGHYNYVSDKKRLDRSNNSVDRNQYAYVYERRWVEPGQVTDVVRSLHANRYEGDVMTPYTTSSRYYERADYIRLKDVDISYVFPEQISNRYRLEKLELFARGTNLLIWTGYENGYDPEVGAAYDFGVYPQGKSFTIGIRTNF